MLLLALLARQQGRLDRAGAFLAVAAFKPATALAFLVLFLRKADWRAWIALAVVSLGLSLAAAPPGAWPTLVAHNLHRIGASGGPGQINDYDFPRAISSDIVAFNHLFHRAGLRDRGLIGGLQWAAVVVLLAGLFAVREPPAVRRRRLIDVGGLDARPVSPDVRRRHPRPAARLCVDARPRRDGPPTRRRRRFAWRSCSG